MYMELATKVIIPLLGILITYVLIPLIKEKTTKEKRENVYFWVKVAVNAAEMIYNEKAQGQSKKLFVLDFLTDKGINIDMDELDTLIEAAVKELKIIENQTK